MAGFHLITSGRIWLIGDSNHRRRRHHQDSQAGARAPHRRRRPPADHLATIPIFGHHQLETLVAPSGGHDIDGDPPAPALQKGHAFDYLRSGRPADREAEELPSDGPALSDGHDDWIGGERHQDDEREIAPAQSLDGER